MLRARDEEAIEDAEDDDDDADCCTAAASLGLLIARKEVECGDAKVMRGWTARRIDLREDEAEGEQVKLAT